jgi:large subunit ribosomal protein L24
MAAKIKKGDKVIILAGKDKGRSGEVMKMITETNRAIVSGVNMVKRHTRATQYDPGGIKDMEAPMHVSNLALVDPKSGKATRVGFKILKDGKKVRFAKKSGEVVDV